MTDGDHDAEGCVLRRTPKGPPGVGEGIEEQRSGGQVVCVCACGDVCVQA